MDRVQHIIPPELKDVSIEELANRRVVRYGELEPDWDAFDSPTYERKKSSSDS